MSKDDRPTPKQRVLKNHPGAWAQHMGGVWWRIRKNCEIRRHVLAESLDGARGAWLNAARSL